MCVTAGSRLRIYGGVSFEWRYEFSLCIKVVLPCPGQQGASKWVCHELTEPAIPMHMIATGGFFSPSTPLGCLDGPASDVVSGADVDMMGSKSRCVGMREQATTNRRIHLHFRLVEHINVKLPQGAYSRRSPPSPPSPPVVALDSRGIRRSL